MLLNYTLGTDHKYLTSQYSNPQDNIPEAKPDEDEDEEEE